MATVLGMISRKGGAGKSTITKLLASAFAFTDHKCLIIDLDPSKDIVNWWVTANETGYADKNISVRAPTDADDLFDLVSRYEDEVEFIIIDTKGEGSSWAVDLASVSDVLIVPCMNAKGDRERTKETLEWHQDLKRRAENPDSIPPLRIVLSRVKPNLLTHVRGNPKPKDLAAREFERHYEIIDQFNPLATMVPEKTQYREMDELGPLGAVLTKCRDSEDKNEKLKAFHFEAALAHAITLVNNIFDDRRMGDIHGA